MGKKKRQFAAALEAAHIAGQVYAGCGDDADPHKLLATMILVEAFLVGGADHAAERLGWEVRRKPASVTSLELVRAMAGKSPKPTDL